MFNLLFQNEKKINAEKGCFWQIKFDNFEVCTRAPPPSKYQFYHTLFVFHNYIAFSDNKGTERIFLKFSYLKKLCLLLKAQFHGRTSENFKHGSFRFLVSKCNTNKYGKQKNCVKIYILIVVASAHNVLRIIFNIT